MQTVAHRHLGNGRRNKEMLQRKKNFWNLRNYGQYANSRLLKKTFKRVTVRKKYHLQDQFDQNRVPRAFVKADLDLEHTVNFEKINNLKHQRQQKLQSTYL